MVHASSFAAKSDFTGHWEINLLTREGTSSGPLNRIPLQLENTLWRLRVSDLKNRVRIEATIRLSSEKASEACISGNWKRVVVKSKSSQDDSFFPITQFLAFDIDRDRFTLGRTNVCDDYLFLSGALNPSLIEGRYIAGGLFGSEELGSFTLTKIR